MTLLCSLVTVLQIIYLHQIACSSSICFDSEINIRLKDSILFQKCFKLKHIKQNRCFYNAFYVRFMFLSAFLLQVASSSQKTTDEALATNKASNIELCFALKNLSHPRIDICIHIIPLTSSRGFSSDEFPPKGLLATTSFSLGHIYFGLWSFVKENFGRCC